MRQVDKESKNRSKDWNEGSSRIVARSKKVVPTDWERAPRIEQNALNRRWETRGLPKCKQSSYQRRDNIILEHGAKFHIHKGTKKDRSPFKFPWTARESKLVDL